MARLGLQSGNEYVVSIDFIQRSRTSNRVCGLRNPHRAAIIPKMAIPVPEFIPLSEIPRQLSATLNRRDLIRAGLLAAEASALGPSFSLGQAVESGLTPAARGEDGAAFLTDPDWKPAFLNDHQNETLIVLSDVVIPATDTPGAKAALVNRYLDLLVSVQPSEFQQEFVAALKSIDTGSQAEFGKDFRDLAHE